MDIVEYKKEYEAAVLSAIQADPEWDMFTNEKAINAYKLALASSLTYVCYDDGEFCGYLRALLDDGFAIYISELFVVPKWRNKAVGRTLISTLKKDYSDTTVYAMSDEDKYYEKLGYKRIGSVFEID